MWFKRETKIYPDPRREEIGGEWAGVFYCRACYIQAFSRGDCQTFQKVVVGDEGFIQLGKGGLRGLWHKVRALTFSFTHLIHHFNQMKSKLMIRIFKLKTKTKKQSCTEMF